MPTIYYENCRCPDCKAKLDEVAEISPNCPFCSKELDPQKVWATRSYAGTVILPPWIAAFGWPFLLMLAGIGLFLYFRSYGEINIFVPGFVFSFGIIAFLFKLNTAGK